jgi:glycosyltransferase involved in cell wall biosynthesis
MKLLWVNANFLHPTTKGGQIRTLEMMRRLHQRHEIHYVAFADDPEGPRRAHEYCTKAYPVEHKRPARGSAGFFAQVAAGAVSPVPVAIGRHYSAEVRRTVEELFRKEQFDRAVCDFLVSAVHFPHLDKAALFQHNVETMIWRRHAEHARDPLRRWFFGVQARRMHDFEAKACRTAGYTIAVSPNDAQLMREMFGILNVDDVPTGVDLDYFAPRETAGDSYDLVFVGSMDWMPNIDGMGWFLREIFPLIRAKKPGCRLAIVGREPSAEMKAHAGPNITVTGTVPEVRPYLWKSAVSIVPLRIGGGTRLKIYESMAAKTAVVSTTVGAEGLVYHDGVDIRIADTPESFAAECLRLIDDAGLRRAQADAGWRLVSERFSWEQVTRRFEELLDRAPAAGVGRG